MRKSSNPILSNSPTFNGSGYQGVVQPGQNGYSQFNTGYQQTGYQQPMGGYQDGVTNFQNQNYYGYQNMNQNMAAPASPNYYQGSMPASPVARMSVDSVIYKSAMTLGTVIVVAALIMAFMPQLLLEPQLVMVMWIGSAIATLVLGFVIGRMKVANPIAIFCYAVLEGVFIGTVSSFFEEMYPGLVIEAVLGTFVAAAVVMAAFKFMHLRVSRKMQRLVLIAMIAYAGVLLVNFLLTIVGFNTGLSTIEFTWVGLVVSLIGCSLAVFSLLTDLTQIEEAIEVGAPDSESWRAAFALTVTLVWLYIEMLRLLSYLRK